MSGELWQLGPLRVEPGQTLRGVFQVDVGVTRLNFPIALIHGTEPDPVVLITAGMDGDEYAAIEAALRLVDEIDASRLAGRVMICPILDPLSFEALQSQNPLDGLFLRHVFPGDLEGKPTQRLAYFIYQNFILHSDAWLHLHTVETGEEAIPCVWTTQTQDAELNEQSRLLLQQAGPVIGLLRPPQPWEPVSASISASTALLVSQAGARHCHDAAAADAHFSVARSVLAGMDMLGGIEASASDKPARPRTYLDCEPLLAGRTGLWQPAVRPGDTVQAGQVVGVIRALDGGSVVEQITSTVDGMVIAVRTGLAARPRLRLALVAPRPQIATH